MNSSNSAGRTRGAPRRTFRLIEPRQQARLAAGILALTLLFLGLAIGNSWAAYGQLFGLAVSTAPIMIGDELTEQTHHYLRVTSMLAVAYALSVLAVSMIFVRQLVGPVIALERHARALRTGDYRSRVGLRPGHTVHADLARQLNDLASTLEHREQAPREDAALPI